MVDEQKCPLCGSIPASQTNGIVPPAKDCLFVVKVPHEKSDMQTATDLVSQIAKLVGANPDAWGRPAIAILPEGVDIAALTDDELGQIGLTRIRAGAPPR